jgi:hypothetical protein
MKEYEGLAAGLPQATLGKMFGLPALMVGKKSLSCYTKTGSAVFKLPSPVREQALALAGATLYDPAGQGRAMKEWIVVPAAHVAQWPKFAEAAYRYLTAE